LLDEKLAVVLFDLEFGQHAALGETDNSTVNNSGT
jgi:hypothetical protein